MWDNIKYYANKAYEYFEYQKVGWYKIMEKNFRYGRHESRMKVYAAYLEKLKAKNLEKQTDVDKLKIIKEDKEVIFGSYALGCITLMLVMLFISYKMAKDYLKGKRERQRQLAELEKAKIKNIEKAKQKEQLKAKEKVEEKNKKDTTEKNKDSKTQESKKAIEKAEGKTKKTKKW